MAVYEFDLGAFGKARKLFGLSRQRSREGHLPLPVQLAEMLWLRLRWGIGPGYYHAGAFWRRTIPWSHKIGHLGTREYYRRLAAINPAAYHKLSQNKIAEKGILHLFAVPTPRFLGFFHTRLGQTPSRQGLRTAADLAALFAEGGLTRVCFKLVEGWGGAGFQAVNVMAGADGPRIAPLFGAWSVPLSAYVQEVLAGPAERGGWIVEQYLDQHERMRAFNPTSVNTMRLWVFRRHHERATVLGGYLRIGRAGALVDNQSSGGIIARIDLATGKLAPATDGHVDRPQFPVHPDHGAPIEGETVPSWPEALVLATSTLDLFPNLRFAGFDVAVAASGPMVIELNVSPDIQGAAEMGLALRSVLRA